MVSHGREKKSTSTKRKLKKTKNGDSETTVDDELHDMDLPEDFSIAGGSSVYSDVNSFNDFDDDVDNEDVDADVTRTELRQSKLLDALALASTVSSE